MTTLPRHLLGFAFLALSALTGWAQQPSAVPSKWEADIQKFEEADRQQAPAKGAALFVGSSSIRMWKELATDFPGVNLLNRGFGGSQIADSTQFADRIVTPYQPRLILLYAGDNDLAAGKTPQQVLADYQTFVRRVRAKLPQVKIAFISIKPSLARLKLMDQIRVANALIRDDAAKHKNLLFVDVFTPMLNEAGQPRPELFIKDGLHMNREGYAIWRQAIAPVLR
jgi:lysophospholipase L1-like esterase